MNSAGRFIFLGAIAALAVFLTGAGSMLTVHSAEAAAGLLRGGFGGAVAVGDGEVFVGEAANSFRPGIVYVYRKTGNSWQESAQLTGPDARVGDQFGTNVYYDDGRVFVTSSSGNGAVHLFTRQGNSWQLAGSLTGESVPGDSVRFGTSLAAAGEWLMVNRRPVAVGRGGRGGRGGGAAAAPIPAGEVYVFRRGSDGRYVHHSTLSSPDAGASAGDNFGSAIALSGTTALIGANGALDGAGVVHEFTFDPAGGWSRTASFAPVGIAVNDAFGSALALLGSTAVVAAPNDGGGYGAAYLFRKVEAPGRGGRAGGGAGAAGAPGGRGGRGGGANANWVEMNRLTSPNASRGEGFAAAIALDAREIWTGTPGVAGTGGIFVFSGDIDNGSISASRLLIPSGLDVGAAAGRSVAIRGNVAAVGATGINRNGGGVLIFERDAGGTWQQQSLIVAEMDEISAYTGRERRCSAEGKVEVFDCGGVEMYSFLPPSKLTYDGHYIEMNDIWGWTDAQTGKEWAIVGRRDGTTFVDISDPLNPVPVADLPLTEGARPASWRDMKVYKDHAYIVSDGAGPHGMQVFDLTRLRALRPASNGLPVRVDADLIYREINSAHNIVINEESGFAYSVGSSAGGRTCGGGLHMIDIREPKNPRFAGCFADTTTGRSGTGYSHDAQCVTYRGPDTRYTGREICVGSNETAISVADVTDKENPRALSRASYPNVAYSHQGWFTEDHKYFFLDDEIDEINGIPKTRTLIWDLSDLERPRLAKEHLGVESSSDHNLYIKGNLMFQANYRSGLRILDIRDPENPKEVAFFDTAPYMPMAPGYNGAWSVYPFFESGTIIVNSIEQGLFMLKMRPIIF